MLNWQRNTFTADSTNSLGKGVQNCTEVDTTTTTYPYTPAFRTFLLPCSSLELASPNTMTQLIVKSTEQCPLCFLCGSTELVCFVFHFWQPIVNILVILKIHHSSYSLLPSSKILLANRSRLLTVRWALTPTSSSLALTWVPVGHFQSVDISAHTSI